MPILHLQSLSPYAPDSQPLTWPCKRSTASRHSPMLATCRSQPNSGHRPFTDAIRPTPVSIDLSTAAGRKVGRGGPNISASFRNPFHAYQECWDLRVSSLAVSIQLHYCSTNSPIRREYIHSMIRRDTKRGRYGAN